MLTLPGLHSVLLFAHTHSHIQDTASLTFQGSQGGKNRSKRVWIVAESLHTPCALSPSHALIPAPFLVV